MDMFGMGYIDVNTFASSICARRVVNNFNATSSAYQLK